MGSRHERVPLCWRVSLSVARPAIVQAALSSQRHPVQGQTGSWRTKGGRPRGGPRGRPDGKCQDISNHVPAEELQVAQARGAAGTGPWGARSGRAQGGDRQAGGGGGGGSFGAAGLFDSRSCLREYVEGKGHRRCR